MWLIIYTLKIEITFLNGIENIETISPMEISNPEVIAFESQVETEVAQLELAA